MDYQIVWVIELAKLLSNLTAKAWLQRIISCTENVKYPAVSNKLVVINKVSPVIYSELSSYVDY